MKLKHKPNTLWLEFGVASGKTINYISKFTDDIVYGFDSFEGLPEKWRDGFDSFEGLPEKWRDGFDSFEGLPEKWRDGFDSLKDYQKNGEMVLIKVHLVVMAIYLK